MATTARMRLASPVHPQQMSSSKQLLVCFMFNLLFQLCYLCNAFQRPSVRPSAGWTNTQWSDYPQVSPPRLAPKTTPLTTPPKKGFYDLRESACQSANNCQVFLMINIAASTQDFGIFFSIALLVVDEASENEESLVV